SRRRHTRFSRDWSSDVCSSDLRGRIVNVDLRERREIIHITLDKSPVLHALVADKIAAILRTPVQPPEPARARRPKIAAAPPAYRSEERRVGKEGKTRVAPGR